MEERDDSPATVHNTHLCAKSANRIYQSTHAQVVLYAPVVFLVLKLTSNRCTGKRQRTQFFPLSQFDDNLLLSDNFFSRFCSLLSNFNTHLAILKICHEWSVVTIEEVYCFIFFIFFISLKF